MTEVWRDIQGFEGYYQISDCGRVWSLDRQVLRSTNGSTRLCKGLILKNKIDKDGYNTVELWIKGKKNTKRCARLVGQNFIPNPHNKPEINHKNGNRSNDAIGNLEWSTVSENRLHSHRILKRKIGTEREIQALNTKGEVLHFDSIKAAERAGFHRNSIYECLNGNYSHHRGFIWSYING